MANPPTQKNSLESWLLTLPTIGTGGPFQIETLVGDGSTRTFYRVLNPSTSATWILLSDPDWKQTLDYPSHQAALLSAGLPVPGFLHSDPKLGFLLMQDLGDELLQHRIQKSPQSKSEWLQKATALLADLHGRLYPVPQALPATTRKFDTQKYFDEFCFTLEHLYQRLLGNFPPQNSQLAALKTFCGSLEGIQPEVFCHRDYHCRNLLVAKESLWIIDFQDARLGPPHYDLASLLYDAYVPITDEERRSLIHVYLAQLKAYPLAKQVNAGTLFAETQRIAYQRTLKAAGSFASFFTRFGKKTHLPFLLPALESAKALESALNLPAEVKSLFALEKTIELVKSLKIQ